MARSYDSPILVVEDDTNDRSLIEMAFRENGATGPIQFVSDGEEAIAYVMGEGKYADRLLYPYPRTITTDLEMPRGDGFMVLEHLKANPDWAVIPTVVLSSSTDADDIKRAYLLGAHSYHVKPNGFEALCQQLKILCSYWSTCAFPEVDHTGKRLSTGSAGKLGERFGPSPELAQRRVQNRVAAPSGLR